MRTETSPTIVGGLILIRAPGLMWFTHVLRDRLRPTFEGRRGLFAAGLLAVVAVEVALSAGLWAGNALASRSQVTLFTGDDRTSMVIAYGLLAMVRAASSARSQRRRSFARSVARRSGVRLGVPPYVFRRGARAARVQRAQHPRGHLLPRCRPAGVAAGPMGVRRARHPGLRR